ncbi:molybdenum cofactor biosynthesis protein B [Marinicaulis aureus]|uniref:Molybdenum cofactor biosynthesis protein B n=1 Tax=Hyphococcus aureus TaxID=2666033 RepID=A0ABW1L1Q5_9PROT
MFGVNEELEFRPVKVALLTVSDTRTFENDSSGDILEDRIKGAGHDLTRRVLLRDEIAKIRQQVEEWIEDPDVDIVITTGGTGLTGRDVTVEALRPLFEKEIEGFSVIFHQVSFNSVGLSTLQSRACAGLARGTFLFLLPGSRGAVADAWDKIICFEIDSRYRPCNLVEIMPRLSER